MLNFKKIKIHIKNLKKKKINTGLSSALYFSCYRMILGHHYFILKFLKRDYFFKFLIFYIKQILTLSNAYGLEIIKNKKNYKYKKICFTWAYKDYFDKLGDINDRYFDISSRHNKSTLWIVLYIDKEKPKIIADNIILISNLDNQKKIKFIKSLFIFFKIILQNKLNLTKTFHVASYNSLLAKNLFRIIKKNIDIGLVEKIFFSYEGQPFQHNICQKSKKINKSIKVYGYISHNLPHCFDMFYRDGSPDYLFMQSSQQKNYFIKNLGWKNSKIRLINSLRFKKTNTKNLSGKIYFSNELININHLSKYFESFLLNKEKKSLPKFDIMIHPRGYNYLKQLQLKKIFETTISEYRNRFNFKLNKKLAIVVGLTSTPIYLIANGLDVIHIVNDEFFDSFDSENWPNIKVKKIEKNVFYYKSLNKDKIMRLKKSEKKNILKNLISN